MRILACGDIHFTNYTLYNNPISDKPESGTRLEDILTAFDMFAKYGYEHDIHTYMPYILELDPDFNIEEAYEQSPFSDHTVKINKSVIDICMQIPIAMH